METAVPIHPSQVVVGLYVWLDLPWNKHPFLYNRLKVADPSQVAIIRELPVNGRLYYYPGRSAAVPAPLLPANESEGENGVTGANSESVDTAPVADWIAEEKLKKQKQMQQQRDAAARAERAWERAARLTHEALAEMTRSPRQAGIRLQELSTATASAIARGEEVVLHLFGEKANEGPHHHAVNVMTLSVLLGRRAGFTEDQLADLALGALAHDLGKAALPPSLLKAKTRSRHEEGLVRQHGAMGAELARQSAAFRPLAMAIIADHHEYLDGSGWPTGKPNKNPGAQIVALVDRYDRLCSPESPDRQAITPAEALARIFRHEAGRFNHHFLNLLIHLLGVYPPGTLVRLEDQSIALVVSPGTDSLRPRIVIYNPQCARKDAVVIDLGLFPELRIEQTLRPDQVSAEARDWLQPRRGLAYFFSTDPS